MGELRPARKPKEPDARIVDLIAQFRANLAIAEEKYGAATLGRHAAMSDDAIRAIRRGDRTPQLDTFLSLAVATGTQPNDWFLGAKAFRSLLSSEDELDFLRPRSLSTASSRSSGDSGAAVRANWANAQGAGAKKRRGSARTSPSDASIRCCRHSGRDQGRWVRASREAYLQVPFRAHAA